VRNLLLAGAAGFLVWGAAALALWSAGLVGVVLAGVGFLCLAFFVAASCSWVWCCKVGKIRLCERILGAIAWRGDETVLDVGCGRGALLIEAAKRLPRGRAIGIDIWQTADLTGNRPEAVRENARREGCLTGSKSAPPICERCRSPTAHLMSYFP
jgi:hypothetical protein